MSTPDVKFNSVITNGNDLYAASKQGVFKSTDKGTSFQSIGSGFPAVVDPVIGTNGTDLFLTAYQGNENGSYVLKGFSGSWSSLSGADGAKTIWVNPENDDIYIGKSRSTNNGSSWSSVSGVDNLGKVEDYELFDNKVYMGIFIKTSNNKNKATWESSNGSDFSLINAGLDSDTENGSFAAKGDSLFFVSKPSSGDSKVYFKKSTDVSFTAFDMTKLPDDWLGNAFCNGYSLFVSSPKGIYRYDLKTLPEVPDTVDTIYYPPVEPEDVSLKSLILDNGTLKPAFSSNTLSYTVELEKGTTTVPTVTAEANDAGANADVQQASSLTGSEAERTAAVTVTGSDGTTTRTYTVEFSIALSSDATLASLDPGEGTLVPDFSSSTLTYSVELPSGTSTVPTASATTNDANAGLDIAHADNLTGTESERTTTITVTAEDGTTQKIYKIVYSLIPEEGKDANLSDLTVSAGTLEPAFAAGIENYTVTLPEGTTEVPTITAEKSDANATEVITQATSLTGTEAERTANVVVTSEDETATRTYSVVFSVETGTPVNDIKENITSIYPNPTFGALTIQSNIRLDEIVLYSITGKKVMQFSSAKKETVLDVSGLDNGMYIIQTNDINGNINTRKIIKQ
jgi:hypothetical protein